MKNKIRKNLPPIAHSGIKQGCLLFIIAFQLGFAQKLSFNKDWKFIGKVAITAKAGDSLRKLGSNWQDQFLIETTNKQASKISAQDTDLNFQLTQFSSKNWQNVILPHNAFPEPLKVINPKEGIAWYKKSFTINKSDKNKVLFLYFEGVMQVADIWINGKYVERHTGGYLPFTVHLNPYLRYGEKNVIYLKLDNRANPNVPPGKPVKRLDFLYYSGIYRNVWLVKKNPLHITNPMDAQQPGGGGIFVTYPQVSKDKATVSVKTEIANDNTSPKTFTLINFLTNPLGEESLKTTSKYTLEQGKTTQLSQVINVSQPLLWHPDHPHLYQLTTLIKVGNKVVDQQTTQIGIRSFEITKEKGLLINGKPFKITGTNRHQSYPYVGNALTPDANYRDAWLIKNANLNTVRLGHYPPDPSFLDAADQLGLLIIDPIPGWQFYNQSEAFAKHVEKDIREMIRRDRNHPSILLWEASLNEAYPSAEIRCTHAAIARSEWPGQKNFYVSGDSYFTKACYDVPYDDWNGDPGKRNNTTYPEHPFLIREYGDYEFGGGSSTSRAIRGKGMDALLQQAWNLQWEHNKNQKSYPRGIGDLTWEFMDGIAGLVVGREGWGMVDIFRIPKFSFYFFQSQRPTAPNPKLKPLNIQQGPMLKIAHYWNHANRWNNVVVYSNVDEVKLYVNDKLIGSQKPDSGPETDYGTELDKGGKPFDGGNANYLKHPPFTFKNVDFLPGTLRAEGYIDGKLVTSDLVRTPQKATHIKIELAEDNYPLEKGQDNLIFVHVKLLDKNGTLAVEAENEITLHLKSPMAKIVSPQKVKAEAGIASFLVRTYYTNQLEISATSKGMPTQSITPWK